MSVDCWIICPITHLHPFNLFQKLWLRTEKPLVVLFIRNLFFMTVDLPFVGTLCLPDRTCMDLHCISFQSTKKPPILVLRKGAAVQSNCWKIFLSLPIKYSTKKLFCVFFKQPIVVSAQRKTILPLHVLCSLLCVTEGISCTSFPHRITINHPFLSFNSS